MVLFHGLFLMNFPTGKSRSLECMIDGEFSPLDRMIYSTVSRILCPHNEVNRTQSHTSTIFIEISTSSVELLRYSIQVDNVSTFILE